MQQDQPVKQTSKDKTADWIELQPVRPGPSPAQILATTTIQQQTAQANKLLVQRSKALAILLAITLFNLCITVTSFVLSALHHNDPVGANAYTILTLLNIPLQAGMAGYLARAKDPDTCKIALKVFLICNFGELLAGMYSFGSFAVTLFTMMVLLVAYARMAELKYDHT